MVKKSFILPGITGQFFLVNKTLLDLKKQEPEMFRDDMIISGLSGNFAASKWAKSNTLYKANPNRVHLNDIYALKDFAAQEDLALYLDIANPWLTEKNLLDYYDNTVLEILEEYRNYVCVSQGFIWKYVKETFPKYALVADEVRGIIDTNFDPRESSFVATYPEDTFALEESKGKGAIMIADSLCYKCFDHARHLRTDCTANIEFICSTENRSENQDKHYRGCCANVDNQMLQCRLKQKSMLVHDDLDAWALSGASFFKLERYPFATLVDYVDEMAFYFAKPECYDIVKTTILHVMEARYLNGR